MAAKKEAVAKKSGLNGNGTHNGVEPVNRVGEALKPLAQPKAELIRVAPLREATMKIPITGSTPLMILRFSQKAKDNMIRTQEAGSQAKSKKKRDPRDFKADYEAAKYVGVDVGVDPHDQKAKRWLGLNASSFRNAAISACRVAGFTMTRAKLAIFTEQDGFDIYDHTPLVRIDGTPEMNVSPVRNASGVVDLRARVMWPQWNAVVKIRFDEDQFSPSDVINLLIRVGKQVGIGEGRPDGREGNGMGLGLFTIDMDNIEIVRLPTPFTLREEPA